MSPQVPKCTQIDESTCQGVIWACQNFFSFTIHSVAVTFLDVIFHLLHFVLNRQNMDFSPALISYFSAQIFNISQPPLLHCATLPQCRNGLFALKILLTSSLIKKIAICTFFFTLVLVDISIFLHLMAEEHSFKS